MEATERTYTAIRMATQREFCWTCEATVAVYRKSGNVLCENCDRPLFDRDDNEIVIPQETK